MMHAPALARLLARAAVFLFVVQVALTAAAILFLPAERLVPALVPDDGFYYLRIAQNLAFTGQQTFDGVNWTNGYHPLWGWLLAGWSLGVRSHGPEFDLRAALLLNLALMTAAAWLRCYVFRWFLPVTWRCGLPLAGALFFFSKHPYFLMETALLLLVEAALQERARRGVRGWRAPDEALVTGGLLAALVLSRLDAVFTAAAFGVCALAALARTPWPRARQAGLAAAVTGAALAPVAAFALFNYATTGHFGTISGTIKTDFAEPEWQGRRLDWLLGHWGKLSILVAAILPAWVALAALRRRNFPAWAWMLLPPAIGAVAHFIFQGFFVKWGAFGWTVATYRGVLVSAVLFTLVLAGRRVRAPLAILPILMGVVITGQRVPEVLAPGFTANNWQTQSVRGALWARENLPEDAAVGFSDCGAFAWFSERRTVNLDGIVNSWEYQEAIRRGEAEEFLRRSGVAYFAYFKVPAIESGLTFRFTVRSYRYGAEQVIAYLAPSQQVYAGPEYFNEGALRRFIIWHWPVPQ